MSNGTNKQIILITDDSEMNRSILAGMLQDDYEILEAENGAQAVDIMRARRDEISALLLDMVMPEMDGLEVLRVMNENRWTADLPVIMISVESDPACVRQAYENGVTEYIMRPFDAIIVRRKVDNTILVSANRKRLMEMVSEELSKNELRKNDLEQLYRCVMKAERSNKEALRLVQDGSLGDAGKELTERLQEVADSLQEALDQN